MTKKCGDHWFVIERTREQIGNEVFSHTAIYCHHCGDIREIVMEPADELRVERKVKGPAHRTRRQSNRRRAVARM